MKLAIGTFIFIFGLLALTCYAAGCNYTRVEEIKQQSTNVLHEAGFTIVGYEGYEIGGIGAPGGKVWYLFQKTGQPETLYHGFISKWGSEYHLYNIQSVNTFVTQKP